jgi:hypothetical protein
MSQPLSEKETTRSFASSREYGAVLKDSSGILNFTWVSDEAHFHSNDYISTDILAKAVNDFVHLYIVHDH